MRKITYLLSLVLIFVIPVEGLLRFPGFGTMAKVAGLVVGMAWVATVLLTQRIRKLGPLQALLILFVAWNGLSILFLFIGLLTSRYGEELGQMNALLGIWGIPIMLIVVLYDVWLISILIRDVQAPRTEYGSF